MIFHYLFAVCSCLQVVERMEISQRRISHRPPPRCLNSTRFSFDSVGHLHLLLPCDLQQRCEEEPQERLRREENGIGRVQHHKSVSPDSECPIHLIVVTFSFTSLEMVQKSVISIFSSVLSAPSTATMLMKRAQYTAQASASPPSPWTARSGQPRAATATWLMHSGIPRSLTTWLLLIFCCTVFVFYILLHLFHVLVSVHGGALTHLTHTQLHRWTRHWSQMMNILISCFFFPTHDAVLKLLNLFA